MGILDLIVENNELVSQGGCKFSHLLLILFEPRPNHLLRRSQGLQL